MTTMTLAKSVHEIFNQQLICPRWESEFRSIYLFITANILKNSSRSSPSQINFCLIVPSPSIPDPSLGWTYWPILVIPVPLACKSLVISRWKSQNIPLSRIITSDVQKLQINWSDFLSHSNRGGHFYRCLGLARDIWEHGNEFLLSQSDKSLLCLFTQFEENNCISIYKLSDNTTHAKKSKQEFSV